MNCPCCALHDDDSKLPPDSAAVLDAARQIGHAARSGLAGSVVAVVILPSGELAGVIQGGSLAEDQEVVGRAATRILNGLSW